MLRNKATTRSIELCARLHGWTSGLHALNQHFDKGGVREARSFRWFFGEGLGMGALSHNLVVVVCGH